MAFKYDSKVVRCKNENQSFGNKKYGRNKQVTMTNDRHKKLCEAKLIKEMQDIKRVYINSIIIIIDKVRLNFDI